MTCLMMTLALWSIEGSGDSTGTSESETDPAVATDGTSIGEEATGESVSSASGYDTDAGTDTDGSGGTSEDPEGTTGPETTGFVTSGATTWTDSSDSCDLPCAEVPPQIHDLEDGDTVRSPLTITWEYGQNCYCDTCGCRPAVHDSASLRVDGEVVVCEKFSCILELDPGPHHLALQTSAWLGDAGVDEVSIVVQAEDPTGGDGPEQPIEDDGSSSGSGASAGDPGSVTDRSGCACSADDHPSRLGFAWLALLPFARRWRRRGSTRTSD